MILVTVVRQTNPGHARPGDLGEHRNDHQLATARRFAELDRVAAAFEANELALQLDCLTADPSAARSPAISIFASPELLASLRSFIRASSPAPRSSTKVPTVEPRDGERLT